MSKSQPLSPAAKPKPKPKPQPLGTERVRTSRALKSHIETELNSLVESEIECHVAGIIADYWSTPLPNKVVKYISTRAARRIMSDLRLKTDQAQRGDPNA